MFPLHAQGRRRRAGAPGTRAATITLLESNVTRMAPCVVSAHGVSTTLQAGDYHTSRFQWTVTGPGGWTAKTCTDPRLGLQLGDTISSATDCEGFNFAFFADVDGTYTLRLVVTEVNGSAYEASTSVVVAADTRTAKYVSASGNNGNDGSIGSPWLTPAYAMNHIVANGKANFSILLNKGDVFGGFDNDVSGDHSCSNIYIGAYGTGVDPIVRWSAASYPTGSLLNLTGGEGIVVQGINFKGNDADNIHGTCIVLATEALNIGLIGLTFGGAASADYPSMCVQTAATNTRNAIPAYQSRGIALFNCTGHSSTYFLYADANDTEGTVSDAGFANNATEFECTPSRLSTTDDVYNGMEIMVAGGLGRNQRRTVLDYVGNTGSGKAKFTLSSALAGTPTSGELVYVASIVDVGDSDIFIFGCSNYATASQGTEARTRLINATRVTAVGSSMDGSTTAAQQKSGWRLMVDYCYLYRCAELNGGVQIGVDLDAGGCGPHNYIVLDRSYLACLNANSKTPFVFIYSDKSVVRACVGKGNLTPGQETNNLIAFSSGYNAVGTDIRILHSSVFMNVHGDGAYIPTGQGLSGRTYWPAAFLTYENNLHIHGATAHYTDFIFDSLLRPDAGVESAIASAVGNVFYPDPGGYAGGGVFSKPGVDLTLTQFNAETFADGNAYGTMDADALVAADYVPTGTTARATTSDGCFQDYYGRSFVGGTYAGAVGKAI